VSQDAPACFKNVITFSFLQFMVDKVTQQDEIAEEEAREQSGASKAGAHGFYQRYTLVDHCIRQI
jgi:hypothetical protein